MGVYQYPVKDDLDLNIARQVLWHFGDTNYGWQPGDFASALMLAIGRADPSNLDKLYRGFPQYVELMTAVQREVWGFDWLRDTVIKATTQAQVRAEVESVETLLVVPS